MTDRFDSTSLLVCADAKDPGCRYLPLRAIRARGGRRAHERNWPGGVGQTQALEIATLRRHAAADDFAAFAIHGTARPVRDTGSTSKVVDGVMAVPHER